MDSARKRALEERKLRRSNLFREVDKIIDWDASFETADEQSLLDLTAQDENSYQVVRSAIDQPADADPIENTQPEVFNLDVFIDCVSDLTTEIDSDKDLFVGFRFLEFPTVFVSSVEPQVEDPRTLVFQKAKSCLLQFTRNELAAHLHDSELFLVLLKGNPLHVQNANKSSEATLIGSASIDVSFLEPLSYRGTYSGVGWHGGNHPLFDVMGNKVGFITFQARLECLGSSLLQHLSVPSLQPAQPENDLKSAPELKTNALIPDSENSPLKERSPEKKESLVESAEKPPEVKTPNIPESNKKNHHTRKIHLSGWLPEPNEAAAHVLPPALFFHNRRLTEETLLETVPSSDSGFSAANPKKVSENIQVPLPENPNVKPSLAKDSSLVELLLAELSARDPTVASRVLDIARGVQKASLKAGNGLELVGGPLKPFQSLEKEPANEKQFAPPRYPAENASSKTWTEETSPITKNNQKEGLPEKEPRETTTTQGIQIPRKKKKKKKPLAYSSKKAFLPVRTTKAQRIREDYNSQWRKQQVQVSAQLVSSTKRSRRSSSQSQMLHNSKEDLFQSESLKDSNTNILTNLSTLSMSSTDRVNKLALMWDGQISPYSVRPENSNDKEVSPPSARNHSQEYFPSTWPQQQQQQVLSKKKSVRKITQAPSASQALGFVVSPLPPHTDLGNQTFEGMASVGRYHRFDESSGKSQSREV